MTHLIGKNIQYLRRQYNISQGELANKLHVSRKTISGWENNRSIPNIELIKNISDNFSVKPSEIIYLDIEHDENNNVELKNKVLKKLFFPTLVQGILILIEYLTLFNIVNTFWNTIFLIINTIFMGKICVEGILPKEKFQYYKFSHRKMLLIFLINFCFSSCFYIYHIGQKKIVSPESIIGELIGLMIVSIITSFAVGRLFNIFYLLKTYIKKGGNQMNITEIIKSIIGRLR